MLGQLEFFGELLVDINAETGRFVDKHVAVLNGGAAGKNFSCFFAEVDALLDTEVPDGQIQMRIGGMADRGDIPGAVPGAANVEPFSEDRDLSRHTKPSHLRDMHSDEVDEPFRHKTDPLMGIVKELTHRDRHTGLLPEHFEIPVVLGRERIFDKERPVWLQSLDEIDGLYRGNPFVNIVQQFDLRSECAADMLEHLDGSFDVGSDFHR